MVATGRVTPARTPKEEKTFDRIKFIMENSVLEKSLQDSSKGSLQIIDSIQKIGHVKSPLERVNPGEIGNLIRGAHAKDLFGTRRTISPDELNKSKPEEQGSNSNKSASNTSRNTPGNNMQKYFKIPNGHLFSFQKEFMNFGFLGKKGSQKTSLKDNLMPKSTKFNHPKITNSFDEIQNSKCDWENGRKS